MKSFFYNVIMICCYILILVGVVVFYMGPVKKMMAQSKYDQQASFSTATPKSLSDMAKESNFFVKNTIQAAAVKIFFILVFAFLAISMLGHITMASSSKSIKRLLDYIRDVKAGKEKRAKLKKGEKFYPVYAQLQEIFQNLESRQKDYRALLEQARGMLDEHSKRTLDQRINELEKGK